VDRHRAPPHARSAAPLPSGGIGGTDGGRPAGRAARLYDETLHAQRLLRILERPEDAEEVLLDVYMKAWKYAGRYSDKRGSVQAWLMIMARNAAIDRIRQRRAQPKTLAFEPETTPEPESNEASPEEQTAERKTRKVQLVLNQLPRTTRGRTGILAADSRRAG
jgi:RNA polymerase sigma-70 factor (ECF subfamily)